MRFARAVFFLFCVLSFGFWIIPSDRAACQEVMTTQPSPAPKGEQPSKPGYTQIVILAQELEERSASLGRELSDLFDKSEAVTLFVAMDQRLNDLADRLEKLRVGKRYTQVQIMELKAAASVEANALRKTAESALKSAGHLEALSKQWQNEKVKWAELRSTLPKDAPLQTLQPALNKGRKAIDSALALISENLKLLVEKQQQAADLKARLGKLTEGIDALLLRAQRDIFRKPSPSMFTSAYYAELFGEEPRRPGFDLVRYTVPTAEYLLKHGWVLVASALVCLVFVFGIRRHRPFFEASERWRFISDRPVAAGLFIAMVFWLAVRGIAPASILLLHMSALCITTARLLDGLLVGVWRRRLVYFLAVFLIVTETLEVFEIPLPIFRLYIFVAALGGFFLCTRRSLRSAERRDSPLFRWALRAAVVVFAAVFIAEIGGYTSLAAHLLGSSLTSVLTLLVAWMLMIFIQGALEWTLKYTRLRSIPLLRSKADLIARRSTLIFGFLVGLLWVSANLTIWGFYESRFAAAHGFLSLGFTLGSWHINLGLILAAAGVLYGSLLVSWAVQAALMEGVFTRREVQAGVRFSMARLVHYAFVLIGVLLALSALGVNLQNITILAGALGVGIGFGLQSIVNNFVCGLILLFERPVKVGDLIEIGPQWAQIKRIGLRATVVETFDQAEVVVPNSDLVNNKVTNWTLSSRNSRLIVPVGVAYGSEVAKVIEILQQCAQEHPKVMKSPPPQVLFMKFGESSLDFELRVYVDVEHRLTVQSDLHQAIDRRFRETGVEIPFPQRDLYIRGPSTLGDAPATGVRQKGKDQEASGST